MIPKKNVLLWGNKKILFKCFVFFWGEVDVFDWMYILWTWIFPVDVHYGGAAAGPASQFELFLISSICIFFTSVSHVERPAAAALKCFLPYCGVLLLLHPPSLLWLCFGVDHCLFSGGFSSLCTQLWVSAESRSSKFVAFQQNDC